MILYPAEDSVTHRTELGLGLSCRWEVKNSDNIPRIMFLRDNARNVPPIMWPDIPLAGHATGTIVWPDDERPTLLQAMAMLPEYEALWEEIRQEHTRSGDRHKVPAEALAWCPNETANKPPAYIAFRKEYRE